MFAVRIEMAQGYPRVAAVQGSPQCTGRLTGGRLAMMEAARHETAQQREAVGRKILLVEDSPLVVMSLEGLFDDMEWTIEGPATRLADALRLAETTTADVALLDVNLDGEMSFEVADRLIARGIPLVFATGYEGAGMLPERLKSVPVVNKPFAIVELEALLKGLVGDA